MLKTEGKQVYLRCGATDMRKAINGLCVLITNGFKLDPFDESLFVFCNRARNRLKVIVWDRDGFWMHFKRLERGHFTWPMDNSAEAMCLSDEELDLLLAGTKLERKLKKQEVTERIIA
jgi:transposase